MEFFENAETQNDSKLQSHKLIFYGDLCHITDGNALQKIAKLTVQ